MNSSVRTYLGILGNIGVASEVGLWLESQLLGLVLGHDKAGGGAVGQVGGVGSGHGSVGLHKGRLQFGHLLLRGHADAVVLSDEILALRHL